MNSWPALQTKLFDGWILRLANGYTKRANSINPIYFSNENIHSKIEECERIYEEKSIPVVFKITPKVFPHTLDKLLEAKGYEFVDATSFQIFNIKDKNYTVDPDIIIQDSYNEGWLNAFSNLSKLSLNNQNTLEEMLNNILSRKFFVSITKDNKTVGCALGVLERNHVGIFDLIVNENYRNRSLGQKLIEGIIEVAKKYNGEKAYLQVVENNKAALNLYNKIGFIESYKYWYRIKQI